MSPSRILFGLLTIPNFIIAFFVYGFLLSIYRLYFHPLSKFPGPRLAAATLWYEFFYDVYPYKGQYIFQLKRLHEKYGPIVRINPGELHISDPDYYDEIYAGGNRKRDKSQWWLHALGDEVSIFETVDHDLHRRRRAAVAPLFSKQSIKRLEPVIRDSIEELMGRFHQAAETGEVVDMYNAYGGMTMDIISEYCFGEGMENLKKPDFGSDWIQMIHSFMFIVHFARQFPVLFYLMINLPPTLLVWLDPGMDLIVEFSRMTEKRIMKMFGVQNVTDVVTEKKDLEEDLSHRTIFHAIARSDVAPREKEVFHLAKNGIVYLVAGTETSARVLAYLCFHLATDPELMTRLREELNEVWEKSNGAVSVTQLEQLPFLTALVWEGLRMSLSVVSRFPRIAPYEVLRYKEWDIPPGTSISQSIYSMHTNPTSFPNPFKFDPQRWIDDKEKRLNKYLVAFQKGSRSCIGINLSYAEMYLTIAYVFRDFDLELFETEKERDIDIKYDYVVGMTDFHSKGIRARLIPRKK